jgi:hypothetical protein
VPTSQRPCRTGAEIGVGSTSSLARSAYQRVLSAHAHTHARSAHCPVAPVSMSIRCGATRVIEHAAEHSRGHTIDSRTIRSNSTRGTSTRDDPENLKRAARSRPVASSLRTVRVDCRNASAASLTVQSVGRSAKEISRLASRERGIGTIVVTASRGVTSDSRRKRGRAR